MHTQSLLLFSQLNHFNLNYFQDRAVCVSVLENMGFRVGQGLIERLISPISYSIYCKHCDTYPHTLVVSADALCRLTRDSPSFKDELDVMKFICKDFWTKVFRRQVDNLRTNHQVKNRMQTAANNACRSQRSTTQASLVLEKN